MFNSKLALKILNCIKGDFMLYETMFNKYLVLWQTSLGEGKTVNSYELYTAEKLTLCYILSTEEVLG